MPRGRPDGYTSALGATICERIAKGESVLAISKESGMPSQSMIYRWLESHVEFREKYARARDRQADSLAEQALEIADQAAPGRSDAARLQVDTRKWWAARLAPRRWGERQHHEVDVPSGIVFRVARPGELDDAGNVKK